MEVAVIIIQTTSKRPIEINDPYKSFLRVSAHGYADKIVLQTDVQRSPRWSGAQNRSPLEVGILFHLPN